MSERTIRHLEDAPPAYRRFGERIRTERGDEITVDADLAAELVEEKGYFEYIDDGPDASAADDDDDTDEEDTDAEEKASVVSAPEEFTVDEIEAELESGEYDDHLESLRENEENGKDRAGVYDAIGVRRAELEE